MVALGTDGDAETTAVTVSNIAAVKRVAAAAAEKGSVI